MKLSCALLALALAVSAFAVPPRRGLMNYRNPDGTIIQVSVEGGERAGFYRDAQGNALEALPDGTLRRATAAPDLDALRRANARAATETITSYPTIGSPKALVLLVEFADIHFSTPNAHDVFTNLVKGENYDYEEATGSARQFYEDNSQGRFTPDFEVFGPIRLEKNEPYYGTPSGMNYDAQAWLMVADAVKQLHEEQPDLDFSQFDTDHDGFVDNIAVFYAGYGQNDGGPSWAIWPHAANLYTMYNIDIEYNGVKFGNYFATNELQGGIGQTLTGIGTFCHEFSHILGLADHYDTRGNGAFTPGPFDLMDQGSYNNQGRTPPYFSAFERYQLGWLNPRVVSAPETITLHELSQSNEAVMIPTVMDNEYFLLENRQRTGWDNYLPGHGMLIWHIDYDKDIWTNNTVNAIYNHQRVDLIEADNIMSVDNRGGDPFPGTSANTAFTAYSTPAMTTYTGVDPDMPITEIRENDGLITFHLKGGGESVEPVVATEATDILSQGFTAHWQGREELSGYELSVRLASQVLPLLTITAPAGAESLVVGGLAPETEYIYTVKAVDGLRKSIESNEIAVTTTAPDFDMTQPVALEAENITDGSFTARWETLNEAESYALAVYTKQIEGAALDGADFTDGSLPDGWYTNSTSASGLNGTFGAARPSLRMQADGDRLQTPVFTDGIHSLTFWYKGGHCPDDARLDVEALVNNLWQTIATIQPISDEAATERVDHMPEGATSLRLAYALPTTAASLYIDDVVVEHGGTIRRDSVSSYLGTEQSFTVTALQPATTYYYTVTATDAKGMRSQPSAEIKVTTLDASGISTITTPKAQAPLYNLKGQRIEKPGKGITIKGGKKIIK